MTLGITIKSVRLSTNSTQENGTQFNKNGTFSITTLSVTIKSVTLSKNDTQYNNIKCETQHKWHSAK